MYFYHLGTSFRILSWYKWTSCTCSSQTANLTSLIMYKIQPPLCCSQSPSKLYVLRCDHSEFHCNHIEHTSDKNSSCSSFTVTFWATIPLDCCSSIWRGANSKILRKWKWLFQGKVENARTHFPVRQQFQTNTEMEKIHQFAQGLW
jgi:hypothetical protein